MTPRSLVGRVLLALATLVILGACDAVASPAVSSPPGSEPLITLNPSISLPPPPTGQPESPVAGVVIAVQSAGLDKVSGFTLLTSGGLQLHFTLGRLDNATDFPPGHLAEHQATLNPVLVFFRIEGGKLVVYHLEDAG